MAPRCHRPLPLYVLTVLVAIIVMPLTLSSLLLTLTLKLSLLLVVCVGSLIFGLFLFAEVKALMAYDEDTEENASESNDVQGQAAVVAAKKSD